MIGLLPRGTLVALFFAALVFAGVQYVPVLLTAWQFYDAIRQEVRFAGTSRDTLDSIREDILLEAEAYEVPLDESAIEIETDGPFFIVRVRYAVPVDLRVYEHELRFDWSLSGESFQ